MISAAFSASEARVQEPINKIVEKTIMQQILLFIRFKFSIIPSYILLSI
jgi:hypothetical protein